MGAEDIRKEYLEWLCRLVGADPDHTLLWRKLHNIMFTWVLPMDENRAEDGKHLRVKFGDISGLPGEIKGACNFLEMCVALATRINDDIFEHGLSSFCP